MVVHCSGIFVDYATLTEEIDGCLKSMFDTLLVLDLFYAAHLIGDLFLSYIIFNEHKPVIRARGPENLLAFTDKCR